MHNFYHFEWSPDGFDYEGIMFSLLQQFMSKVNDPFLQ